MQIHVRQICFFLISCHAADVMCAGSLSTSSSTSTEYQKLTVRILTPTVFSPALIANYSKIGPGFDLALQDIKLLYPSLDVVQELIYDSRISTCPEWEINVENLLAASFYRVLPEKVSTHSVTAVVTGGHITQISHSFHPTRHVLYTYDWKDILLFLTSQVAPKPRSWQRCAPTGILYSWQGITVYMAVYRVHKEIRQDHSM